MTKRKWRPYKATKREVLSFFAEREVVTARSLMDKFGYTYHGAYRRIGLLHREGLIEPLLERGSWGLTKKGERRLLHYEQR